MTINFDTLATRAAGLFDFPHRHAPAHPRRGFNPFHGAKKGTHIDTGSGDDKVYVRGKGNGCRGGGHGEPVAANEYGRIWDDPHFKGGDGGRFDVQGRAGQHYDLLSDDGLQLNGRFDGYGRDGTAVGETGLSVKGADGKTSNISFRKDGAATINGEAMEKGREYTLADGGSASLHGNTLTVTTAEGYYIQQEANRWQGDQYINVDVKTGSDGVDNGRMPGGLLGHTFDADDVARNGKTGHGAQGEGAIDGRVQDYETGGLFNAASNHGTGGPVHGDHCRPTPTPTPEEPIAANETGRIWGDPHFVGGDGGKYDIQGEAGKVYDLLTDSGLELRGQFDGWSEGTTVVGETGLTVGEGMNSDNINFRKDGSARINGQLMEEGKTYELADGGNAKLDGKTLTVTTAEGYTIEQTAKGSGDKEHININVATGENGVGNGQVPGGLLGQTFDADNEARNGKTGKGAQGEGAIDGTVGDYERPALDPMNDDRGTTEESDDPLQQFMEKFQQMMEQFMDLLNQRKQGSMQQPAGAPKMETHTDTGSGDDDVKIVSGGQHTVGLGSGDDKAYVDFKDGDTGNTATINGGSGDDTVTLGGVESDYTVRHEGDATIYTDQDGNTIRVAKDVEQVRFETAEAA